MPNLFSKKSDPPDAIEEHHISLRGMDIAYNYATRTAFLVDQTGSDASALRDLEDWLKAEGWFLHAVSVTPAPPAEKSEPGVHHPA